MGRDEIVGAVFEQAWNRQRYDAVAEALAEFRFHIGGRTVEMGLSDLRAIVAGWHRGFPDLRFEIGALVVSGDDAAVRATLRGTNTGPWRDREPTGRAIDVEHAFFLRFAGSRITDVWEVLDTESLRAQLKG